MLFGYVGTPTSTAAVPLTKQAQVPFFAPFTGAEFLRTPVRTNIYNVRASYLRRRKPRCTNSSMCWGRKTLRSFTKMIATAEPASVVCKKRCGNGASTSLLQVPISAIR